MLTLIQYVIGGAIGLIIGAIIGVVAGIVYRKKVAEAEIGSAEAQAKKIVDDAVRSAETRKKEALIEAKELILRDRNEFERDVKERRSEVSRLEKRAVQKEEQLDRKLEAFEKKEEQLQVKVRDLEERAEQISELRNKQLMIIQEISGYTAEQAKNYLISQIESEARHDAAMRLVEIEQQTREEADGKAKNLISLAVQRLASDYVSEVTVSVVNLPNDEMKGRIIGREGRNIRTIETLTGVDLIIDDTPEAITISSFDPVRREVARLALEKLISDGRIHPSRIEETVDKATREVDNIVKSEGERATFITGIHGINHELIKMLGRLKYRTSYGQNVLAHSIEVASIAGMLAAEIGADVALAKRAGLLHDIGKAATHEIEGSHVQIGVDIAKKYKEGRDVIHAIEAHHGDVEPTTVIAMLVQAADAISAARPGARRENLENYIKRLEKLEEIANSFKGVEKSFAIQAGREIRIIVKPDEISDDDMIFTIRDIVKKIETDLSYPGQIKVHMIRESRQIDFAK